MDPSVMAFLAGAGLPALLESLTKFTTGSQRRNQYTGTGASTPQQVPGMPGAPGMPPGAPGAGPGGPGGPGGPPPSPSEMLPHRPGMRIESTPQGDQTTLAPSMLEAILARMQQQQSPQPPPNAALLQMLAQRGGVAM